MNRFVGVAKRLILHIRRLNNGCYGLKVPLSVRVGRNCRFKGEISIQDDTVIEEGVWFEGNIKIGSGCHIQRGCQLTGNITVGNGTTIGAFSMISTMPAGSVDIGSDVLVNSFSTLGACERLTIGNHCIFAAYVHITDAAHRFEDGVELTKHAAITAEPVCIESNVWLGSGAMVTKGVTIGTGSVVGAKALVTRSIPRNAVAYGIPAKVKKVRDQ